MDRNTLLAFFLISLVLIFTPKYIELISDDTVTEKRSFPYNETETDTLKTNINSQFEDLNLKLKCKRKLHSNFVRSFKDIEDVEIMKEAENCKSNYWLITLRLKGENVERLRNDILNEAHKLRIFLRPSWIL